MSNSRRAFAVLAVALCVCPGCDLAAPRKPAASAVFGHTGHGPGEFSYPRAAALAPDGRVFIVDKSGRIQRVDGNGAFSGGWAMPETRAGKPTGLCCTPASTSGPALVWVADTHYARVMVYDADGEFLRRFGSFGDGPGEFRLPTDVAVDPEGFIYVSEYGGNDRVSKFTPEFQFVLSFGRPGAADGEFQRPQGLLIDPDGTLWVADACNHRICHFDPQGTLLGAFGSPGSAPGELRFPYGVDRLSDGTLVVAEYGNNRVQRFSRDGRSLGTWGTPGRAAGQLAYPWAVAVDPADRLFVVDSGNNRVQVVGGLAKATWVR